jgi:hypothetical protein
LGPAAFPVELAPVPRPPKPPKPVLQPLGPGLLMVMDFAVMVPVLLAGPMARAHWPTTAAALVAGTVWVTVAEEPRVMVMVLGLAGAPEPAALGPLRSTPLRRIVEPDTELTVPVALANARRVPDPPPAPVGRRAEPAPPNPPPAPVVGQAPLTFAMMRAEVAVRALAEPAAGVPVTMTQPPAAMWPEVTAVNVVALV